MAKFQRWAFSPVRLPKTAWKLAKLQSASERPLKIGRRFSAGYRYSNTKKIPSRRARVKAAYASPARTASPAAHFDRSERYAYFGDRTLDGTREIQYWHRSWHHQLRDGL